MKSEKQYIYMIFLFYKMISIKFRYYNYIRIVLMLLSVHVFFE